jgi:SAM-dependent methyltransferase
VNEEALGRLDARLANREATWWNSFYENRAKPCAFFGTSPDESLASWIDDEVIPRGRAIDLGCGNARNAIHLAKQGFSVEAVDYSETAIVWARERVAEAGVSVQLHHRSVFDMQLKAATYDLVYDSGCFHHIAPHRRAQYVDLVAAALRPGGWFGLTCFRPEGGSGFTDDEVYERGTLGGGLGYSEESLREIWSRELQIRSVRQMKKPGEETGLFGETYLWVLLAQKT